MLPMRMRMPATSPIAGSRPALVIWLAIAFLPAVIGMRTPPDDWFRALRAPPLNPPGWLFAPVWTLLYASIGIAAWLLWRRAPWAQARAPWVAFAAQLALNAAWTPLFFARHRPDVALACILALDLAIAACIVSWSRHRRSAAMLLVPYALWVAFATYLNAGFWWLNRS